MVVFYCFGLLALGSINRSSWFFLLFLLPEARGQKPRLLQNITNLLFSLLQFVLHLDDDCLDVHLISFRAKGVDFAAHLLGDESEFLARLVIVATLVEIVAMLAQAYLFLSNIKFLEIIDQFLLKAVLVVLSRSSQLREVLGDALLRKAPPDPAGRG